MKISKKIVLLGYFGVGKTSLIRQFVENVFTEDYKVSIGVHILKKEVKLTSPNKEVTLVIWDLEGNNDINNTRVSYLLGTHSFIYVYDVSRPETYNNLDKELSYFEKKYPNIPLKVVGNKIDLVTKKIIKEQQKEAQIRTHFYTSAKKGENVESLFHEIAQSVS